MISFDWWNLPCCPNAEDDPNGDAAVVGVGDPKMEGDFAAVEVAPPPKIDPEAAFPPNTDPGAADAVVVLAVDPPKERAEPKVCPRPDPKPDELAGVAAGAAVVDAALAAPNVVGPVEVAAAPDPNAGAAEPKGLEAAEVVVAKTEEPVVKNSLDLKVSSDKN